jgi:hypothetical protein
MSASKVTFAYLLPQSYPTLSIGKTTASVTFDVSGDTSISGNLNVYSGLIFTNASTNRVGIGKTNPTVLFDVSGDTTITGNLNVDSGLIFTDASINRVGIGKTNPTVLFDVSGNTSISGTLTVDTNTLFVDTINKRIGIRKTNPGTVLDVSGNGAIAGNLTVGMLPILNVDSSNNRIGIGVVNPTRTLDISGSTRISAALDVSGATAITGNLVVNTNNLFVDAANGRVGIGMNNPSRALEVTGAARITSTLDVSGATAITGNLTVKTNVLAVDTTNNRVGIGMNNPITPFQVSLSDATRNATTRIVGDITTWDNTYAIFGRPTVTSGVTSGAVGIGYNDASGIGVITCLAPGNAWKDMNYTASAHRFHGNGAERVTITGSTGYVGIGMTNPSFPLHINTTVSATTGPGQYISHNSGYNVGGWGGSSTAISIGAIGSIVSQANIVATNALITSDVRIKTNIQDLNSTECLSLINIIQPKTYEYVDKVNQENRVAYGFIAQHIKELLPHAVSIMPDTIPSIYKVASRIESSLTIDDPSGELDLTQLLSIGDKVRLYDKYDKQIYVSVISIESSSSFTFSSEELLQDSQYFVYGKEVRDFHILNNNYIFTANVSATQELSRKITNLDSEVQTLQQENALLKQRLERLYTHLGITF